MSAQLEVLAPGTFASVQDAGRIGYRAIGVTRAGALDGAALALANELAGNPSGAAGIELTYGGASLRVRGAVRVALTGAPCDARVDGVEVGWSQGYDLADGALLEIGVPKRGVCSYVAVGGGIDVPAVLGSRSTDLLAGFGGFEGRALGAGDRLPVGAASALGAPRYRGLPAGSSAVAVGPRLIRMLAGGEFERFSAATRAELFTATWRVDPSRNRVGMRLSGEPLESLKQELRSHAVFPGVVQLPPNGQPIVLLADAPTTGGYPKLGVVIAADLALLAQLRPHEAMRFVRVDPTDR